MTACNQSIPALLQDQEGELAAVPDTEIHGACMIALLNDITDLTVRLWYRDLSFTCRDALRRVSGR
jgi:hypothetical protein